ncbi:MAG: FMN-binding protein [Bacteroidales bacterium]|nr:FMN-binding protein [Bacteroidales bacterium]
MKKIIVLALTALLTGAMAQAQHDGNHCGNCPHHQQHHKHQQRQALKPAALQYNADGIETTIVVAFPTAKTAKKQAKWTEVYDGNRKLLGYAVYSSPASDGIKGFNGATPVMIALDAKKVIRGVYMLPNVETPQFAQRVSDAGFLNNWNGLTVKQALKKDVDAVSGATFTSRAVAQSVQAALNTL